MMRDKNSCKLRFIDSKPLSRLEYLWLFFKVFFI
jgi:hypothetical protein